ncbi:hypothetical protein COV17_00740 [Candidatus Woesearchaeota archaeon CG10_big_fil_rev_8_21_14_0_10_36_11]|nr:MAG: hypothetical protein COV17_00740 [Candidatus Woesearchaeota archaeon CG10_big_fil_rev_8_21_14_0_10_36_11]
MERGDKTLFPSAVSLEGRVYLPIRKEKFLDGSGSWQFICKDGRQLVFYGVVSETIGDKEELRLMELCDFETRAGDSPGQPKGENHGDTKIVTGISPYLSYENKQLKGQFI